MAIGTLAWNLVVNHRGVTEGLTATRKEFAAARAITTEVTTESEKYADRLDQLNSLLNKNLISVDHYNRAVAKLKQETYESTQEFKDQQAAMQRGAAVTRSVETATEKYERELKDLNDLLQRGAISQETFRRAVAKAAPQMDATAKATGAATAVASRLNPTLIAVAAGAAATATAMRGLRAVIDGTREAFGTLDEATKKARLFGTSIDELRAFRNATAEMAGVASNAADTSLQRFTRRLAQAAQGTGEARKTIDELGLSAEQLQLLSPVQALQQIADKVQDVDNASERLRIGFTLFGREGASLAMVLAGGSEALREQEQLFKDYGLSISELDTGAIEAANDQWARLGTILTGVFEKLAVEFAPLAATLTGKLLNAGKGGIELGEAIEGIADAAAVGIGTAIDYFNQLVGTIRATIGVGRQFIGILTGDMGNAIEETQAGIDQALSGGRFEASSNLGREVDALAEKFRNLAAASKESAEAQQNPYEIDVYAQQAAFAEQIIKREEEARRAAIEAQRERVTSYAEGTAAIREQLDVLRFGQQAVDEYKARQMGIPEALIAQRRALEGVKTAMEEEKAALAERNNLLARGRELMKANETEGQKFARSIADLARLLRVGAIDVRTFNAEREKLIDTAMKEREVTLDQANTAILKGSGESAALEAQRLRDQVAARINERSRGMLERSADAVTKDVITKGDKFVGDAIDRLGRTVERTAVKVEEFRGDVL